MGFSFVDQLTAIDSDRAHGILRCPKDAALHDWLVIEAVGQLAAWIAMARTDFSRRPVAALVGEIRLSGTAARGDIDLEARIERLDSRAILYVGTARRAEVEIASLSRCVGPLLPMELFDDPEAVRARFAALRSGDASATGIASAAGAHPLVAPIELSGDSASSRFEVPAAAPFFADHFPRRPVYPASLLADALGQVATPLAARTLGVDPAHLHLAKLTDYKVRAFSPPGQCLDLHAKANAAGAAGVEIHITASSEGKRVAGGKMEFKLAVARAA